MHPFRTLPFVRALLGSCVVACTLPAQAGSDPFSGELMLFGGNFCPTGWMPAQGQVLSISENNILYALLGTTYGGNGTTTFALPDLRGRAPIGAGQGPGLSAKTVGQAGGSEAATLTAQNLPLHHHALAASAQPATHATPAAGQVLGTAQNAGIYATGGPTVNLAPTAVAGNPSPAPFSIRNPYLAMTWCIATEGIFPTQN